MKRWWPQEKAGQSDRAPRIAALDALRGLIMVLMALDHANHFVAQKHSPGEYWGGTFPVYDDTLSFLTRLVTHLAAPGFFFLMGAGMWLFARSRRNQGWSQWAISKYFLIRGGLLIALQFLVVNRAWALSPGGWVVERYVGVLFALGGAMILGCLFLQLGARWLLPVFLLLVVGTELLVPAPGLWGTQAFDSLADQLNLWLIYPGGTAELWSNYPLLPWLELVVFGMLFGEWLLVDTRRAFQRALGLGGICIGGFAVLRLLGGFGNIRPAASAEWIDFLNLVKYPPSLTFSLMTMGVNLLILGAVGRWPGSPLLIRLMATYGRVPLFFYITHLFLYAGLGWWFTPEGTSIREMYSYWLVGLALLYPLCYAYGQFKRKQPVDSVWHFL